MVYLTFFFLLGKPKDPGIPNEFPYKDQILAEVAEQRRIVSVKNYVDFFFKKKKLWFFELGSRRERTTES